MKKILKNKFVLLTVIAIILSIIYILVNKAIKQYDFSKNGEIVTEENEENKLNSDNKSDKDSNKDLISENEEKLNEIDVNNDEEADNNIESEDIIYVYITGEVNEPGVVKLNKNSRIIDAIDAAGGTTDKADISKVNLAYVLKDGMKVNIPNAVDLKNNSDFEYITMSSGDGKNDEASDLLKDIENNNVSNGVNSGTKEKSYGNVHGITVVNINTATQTELETLPGVGPSIALKIINYRNENGGFSSIEDIKNVSRNW